MGFIKTSLTLALGVFIFVSCNRNNSKPFKVAEIEKSENVDIKIKRFENALFQIKPSELNAGLKKIQKEFRFFLNADLNDTINTVQMYSFISDPLIQDLYKDVSKKYFDLSIEEKELSSAFSFFKHYFPSKLSPQIFSYVSGLAYENPIKYNDTSMAIALDCYFGKNSKYYNELKIPVFISMRMQRSFISIDCMKNVVWSLLPDISPESSFIERMIYDGKVLYFLDAVLPEKEDTLKIGYTFSQMDWCNRNQGNVWAYIIDNQLLYTTDFKTINMFFGERPFTSIFTNKSPARLGSWIGWQLIRAYMQKNKDITLAQLLEHNDPQQILNKSGYHPKK